MCFYQWLNRGADALYARVTAHSHTLYQFTIRARRAVNLQLTGRPTAMSPEDSLAIAPVAPRATGQEDYG